MTEPTEPRRWEIFVPDRVWKELDRLPDREQQRVHARLTALCAGLDAGRAAGDVRKLQGEEGVYRLRSGDYRVLFEQDAERRLVVVLRVAHRRDVYR